MIFFIINVFDQFNKLYFSFQGDLMVNVLIFLSDFNNVEIWIMIIDIDV